MTVGRVLIVHISVGKWILSCRRRTWLAVDPTRDAARCGMQACSSLLPSFVPESEKRLSVSAAGSGLGTSTPIFSMPDWLWLHDYIVQARGAFDQTVTGLHHLARWQVPVELRVVLHKLSIPRLHQLAEYIYRNLPFVIHVALMGLEPTGYTPYHRDKLWLDPYEYQDHLADAVDYLSLRGMHVSIYNLQRCVLPPSTWAYARQSISDWKNIYLPECEGCAERTSCAGVFQSAERLHSSHIHAL
jgi:His-Xaa-Ser system radical SAM maturase HxsC